MTAFFPLVGLLLLAPLSQQTHCLHGQGHLVLPPPLGLDAIAYARARTFPVRYNWDDRTIGRNRLHRSLNTVAASYSPRPSTETN